MTCVGWTLGCMLGQMSTEDIEIGHFVDYLVKQGWLDAQHNPGMQTIGSYLVPGVVRVTVNGHSHIADQRANVDLAQAFVAMWFGDNMKEVYDKGIAPAIIAAEYKPFRIDQEDYLGRVEDKIIAEIRRSRFVVADFTHGEDGVRGGVYYEAGFAQGLNLQVIPMCNKEKVDNDPILSNISIPATSTTYFGRTKHTLRNN